MNAQATTTAAPLIPRRRWLYGALMAVQTVGAFIFYANGLPIYRELSANIAAYERSVGNPIWALSSIALMQIGYWLRFWLRPAFPKVASALLGHIVQFISLTSFTVATSIFSFVFVSQKLADQMPIKGYVSTLIELFSLFLYRQELQNLGNALSAGAEKKCPPVPAEE